MTADTLISHYPAVSLPPRSRVKKIKAAARKEKAARVAAAAEQASPVEELQPLNEDRTIVQIKEGRFDFWSEAVDVSTLSRFGASFRLSRECIVGQLICLILPRQGARDVAMPPDSSRAVCLVQQSNKVSIAGNTYYDIGVVFVGNSFPASYQSDPYQCYRVVGSNADGTFKIGEAGKQFKVRRHPRFNLKLEVTLLLIEKSERTIQKEIATTKDVSAAGISVVSSLNASVGDKLKIGCREIDFYALAVVKNKRSLFGFDELLHLEFESSVFPVDRVLFGRAA